MTADRASILATINARLPKRSRWLVLGTPLDFDFTTDRFTLRRPNEHDIVGGPLPVEWRACRLIGQYDWAEGGGARPWIAVSDNDGRIYGLDIERPGQTTFLFNSSLDQFIRTFTALDRYFREGLDLPSDCMSDVEAVDSIAFPSSEWRALLEYTTAG